MHEKLLPQLVINAEIYLPEFIKLNESWISEYFDLEEADYALAANPQKIIDDGGYIFTLLLGNSVVGVCALFNQGRGTFQLARMAVRKDFQGNGYGGLLMDAALAKLEGIKATAVSLLTNSQLVAAINLYKKYGFRVIKLGSNPIYKRVDVEMQLNLFEKGNL